MKLLKFLVVIVLMALLPNLQAYAQEYVKISGVVQYPLNATPQTAEIDIYLSRGLGTSPLLAKATVQINERFELFAPKNEQLYLFVTSSYLTSNGSLTRMTWRSERNSYRFTVDREMVISLPSLIKIQGTLEDASGQPLTGKISLGLGWFSDKKVLANDGIHWTSEGQQFSYTEVTKSGSFVLYGAQNARQTLRAEVTGLEWRSSYFSSVSDTSIRVCLPVNFGVNRELSKDCLLEQGKSQPAMEAGVKGNEQEIGRKLTITCVKGKTVKKIKKVNPKCPKGYKKN